MNGVPTSLSTREVVALCRIAKGKRVVEAGALLGFSAITLAKVASQVTSIDKHIGYNAPTLRQYQSNLDRMGVGHLVRTIVGDAITELPKIEADVAFIDLTGTRELTRAAAEATTATIVAIHDACRNKCEGVELAVKDTGLIVVAHVDSLIICGKTK